MTTALFTKKNPYHFTLLLLITMIFSACSPNKIFRTSDDIRQLPLQAYMEKMQKETDHYLIDVRTAFEYKKQHLQGATNISFVNFKFKREINKLDRNKTVFIYCETAHRSPYAAKKLNKMGFKKIFDLEGGYKSYRKSLENEQLQNSPGKD